MVLTRTLLKEEIGIHAILSFTLNLIPILGTFASPSAAVKSYEYLEQGLIVLKPSGGYIHHYAFEHATRNESPVEKVKARVSGKLRKIKTGFVIPFGRIVRTIGTNWYQIVIDIRITSNSALSI